MFHLLLTAFTTAALATANQADPETKARRRLHSLLDKRAVIEGIAWDCHSNWRGRIQLPCGYHIYVTNVDGSLPVEQLPQGKLVRVVGTLTHNGKLPVADGFGGQPLGGKFWYLEIRMESWQVIERASEGLIRAAE